MPKSDFKFRTEFRVRWMECDAQGIVFNGAYLGYLEVAQAEYYRNLGIGIYHLPQSGYFDFAVVKTTLEFKAPARVDEIVEAYVRVSRIGNTSLVMEMELHRPNPELLLTTVEAVYVGYDASTEATRRVPRRPARADRPLRADRPSPAPLPIPGAGRGIGAHPHRAPGRGILFHNGLPCREGSGGAGQALTEIVAGHRLGAVSSFRGTPSP